MHAGLTYGTVVLIAVVLNLKAESHINEGDRPVDWHNHGGRKGQQQSPINIQTRTAIYRPNLKRFAFNNPSTTSKWIVENDGHTIKVNTEGNFYVHHGGLKNVYSTVALHFHWGDSNRHGSEHTIDGRSYPLEMHIVNWNSDKYKSVTEALKHPDGLAVLGVLFEISTRDNPVLEPIIKATKQVRDPDQNRRIEIPAISVKDLLPPAAHRYYRYHGSLTTPNYDESVIWTVFNRRSKISERQLNVFRNCLEPSTNNHGSSVGGVNQAKRNKLVNNNRQVQPLGRRHVYKSFGVRRVIDVDSFHLQRTGIQA